jgi:hypothetical protein
MTKFLKNVDVTGYVSQTSVTSSLLKTDANGKLVAAIADTDYATPGVLASADKMVTVGRNATGATLYKGTIIYISGSTGNRPNFVKAQANSEATSAGTFGVILADIPNNSDGSAVTVGTVDNLDTRSVATNPFTSDTLVDGDTIYLSPTTAGYVTRVKPSAPNHIVYIGKVVRTSPTNGTIVYRIQNGYELDEIHDVSISSLANNQTLVWESATSLWKNKTIAAALGYTPADDTTVVKLTGNQTIGGVKTFSDTITASSTLSINGGVLAGNNIVSMRSNATGGQFRIEKNDGSLSAYPFYIGADGTALAYYYNAAGALKVLLHTDGTSYFGNNLSVGYTTYAATTYKLDVNGTARVVGPVLANAPSEGATGEGLIAGQSFKIDATATGQRAAMYVVSNVLSDTYASGLQAQYANFAGDKGFGFNLNTTGGFELYVKNTSWNKALTIANTKAATFTDTVTATSFIKTGGTSVQFLKADGSLDSSTYLTSSSLSGYLPLTGGTLTGALNGTSATFSGVVTATGNAATSSAVIFNNENGASGTAQYYTDFKAGATIIGRILRGNGAAGYESNGLNFDNYAGMLIKLNSLGGSGGGLTVVGGATTLGAALYGTSAVFSSTVQIGNNQVILTPSYTGYSASYKVLAIGTGASNTNVSINYDPSGNAGGEFNGTGQIFIAHNKGILAPNAANNNYIAVLRPVGTGVYFGGGMASGELAGNGLFVSTGGKVGINTASPSKSLHVYTADNEGIYLQGTSGGVWMNIQSVAGNLWSIGAQNDGMGIYNRTSSLYAFFIKDNRQLQLAGYTASSSFSGTAAGYLAFDSSGNVITLASVAATDSTKLPLAGGTMTGIIAFSNVTGNKIDFYYSGEDRYGIQVQSDVLRIHSGAQGIASGGIVLGKSTSTAFTEAMRIRNDGIVQVNGYLRTAGATSNTILWAGGASSADFGNVLGQGTSSRSTFFRGASSSSVWWGGTDGLGNVIPFTALDATSGEFTFWRNSGGVGGGSWTQIMTMNASGLTINSGNFVGNLTGDITGSASSATTATNVASPDGDRNPSTKLPTTNPRNVRFDFATSASIGGTGNYGGVMTYTPWDGTSASTGDSSYQLAFLNETGVNASGVPGLSLRNGINSTWNAWYRIITSGNIGSQSVSNATTAGGLAVHTGRNNAANQIVRTDANGYIQAGWLNTPSGVFSTAINKIYCSDDDYMRFQTPATFISNLGLVTVNSSPSFAEATFGTTGGSNNQGIQIRFANATSGYGRIRFYENDTNTQTIHCFSAGWQGGGLGSTNSAGGINIAGTAGVTFGSWNSCDAYIATGGAGWFRGTVTAPTFSGALSGNATTASTASNVTSISSATGGAYTWTATNYFQSNLGGYSGTLNSPPLQAYATGGNSAFMSFHRAGNYAVNFGLDADNVFRIGGWSASPNRLQLDMSGNLTVAATVNAPSGYVSSPNPLGTSDSAFFPNGITTAGGTNWIYGGNTYIGNAPSNGAGHQFTSGGDSRHTGTITPNYIGRPSHSTGFLVGSYNNIGGNSGNTNPIYTIGSSYTPNDTSLINMYGIGYAHPNLWGAGKTSSWGLYVCEAATINATIGGGAVTIWAQNDIVAYSDIRVKDNIEVIPNAVSKIQALRGVTFTRIDAKDEDKDKRHAGVIAQEVLAVHPEVVSGTEKDMYSVAYGNMAGLFIEAFKEQQLQIEELKSIINDLAK